jgi:hypothetical protein
MPERCRDPTLDNNTLFNTMVRVGGSWSSLGSAFVFVMQTYGWQHVVIVSDTAADQCYYAALGINNGLTAASTHGYNFTIHWLLMTASPSQAKLDEYLTELRSHSRGEVFSVLGRLFVRNPLGND